VFDCGRTDGRTFLPGLLGHLSGDDLTSRGCVAPTQCPVAETFRTTTQLLVTADQ